MATLPSQVATQFIVTNIGPIISSVLSSAYSSYTTPVQHPTVVRQETDDERELDLLQMERLLKWMRLIFDDSQPSSERDTAYKKNYITFMLQFVQIIYNTNNGRNIMIVSGCFLQCEKRIQKDLQGRF